MKLAEIMTAGVRLLRDHFAVLVGIGLVLFAPMVLIELRIEIAGPTSAMPVAWLSLFALQLLISPIAQGAMVLVIQDAYHGRRMGLVDAYRASSNHALALIGTSLLLALGVVIGCVLLVVPGVYLMIAWALAIPVVVLESIGGIGALSRSRELLRGHMWQALALLLATAVGLVLIDLGSNLLLSGIPIVEGVVDAVVQSAGMGFYTAIFVVLYLDLISRAASSAPPQSPPPA